MIPTTTPESKTPRDHALTYIHRGWAPIPIPTREKGPRLPGWQRLRIAEADISKYFHSSPQNIGILLGEPSHGLIDIDLDHPDAVRLAPRFLPPTNAIFGRPGKLESHWLYNVPECGKSIKFSAGRVMVCEYRSTGLQTVFPGSVHPSGETITWSKSGEPKTITREKLLDAVQRLTNEVLTLIAADEWLTRAIQKAAEGSRNDTGFWLACQLRDAKVSITEALSVMTKFHGSVPQGTTSYTHAEAIASCHQAYKQSPRDAAGTPASGDGPAGAQATAEPPRSESKPTDAPRFRVVPIWDVLSRPEPPQLWLIDGLMPAGLLTLLGGHGGAGKSLLAMIMAAHVAMGEPWAGRAVTPSRVVYFSAEDALPMLRRRAATICDAFGFEPGALAERLTLLDAVEAATLYSVDAKQYGDTGATTSDYDHLRAMVEGEPCLAVVDNASDCFDGSENSRREVKGFTRAMADLARDTDGAVLLLAHVSRANAIAGGRASENYSGSTAWHNGARSRLALVREDDGSEAMTLRHEKCNVGARQADIALTYDLVAGVIRAAEPGTAHEAMDRASAILRMLVEFAGRGEVVYSNPRATNNVYRALSGEAGYPAGMKRTALEAAMRDLQRRGLVEVGERKDGYGRPSGVWAVTAAGRASVGGAE